MAKRNTHRNKCMRCGEQYKSFHLCKTKKIEGLTVSFSSVSNPELWGDIEVSGTGYARLKPINDFDEWFASIEKYIENQYC